MTEICNQFKTENSIKTDLNRCNNDQSILQINISP